MNAEPVAKVTITRVGNDNESALQESQRVIDEKIAQLERSILQLKSKRNELSRIFRLPPEILGTIFAFIVAEAGHPYRPRSITTLVNFSHVCRFWRSVALNTPNIWCSIPFHNQQLTNAMLERSKSLDLFVNEDFTYSSDISPHVVLMKEILNCHPARFRGLCLTGFTSSILLFLLGDLQPSSLRLHTLRLAGDHRSASPVFPTGLLSNPEILRVVDVTKCSFDWIPFRFAALTSLKIHKTPDRPCWSDFITTLQTSSALEILDMEDSLPLSRGVDSSEIAKTQIIRLMNLRKLSLCSTTSIGEVLNVLPLIVVPQTANLKFRCPIEGTSQEPNIANSLSDLASSLSRFFSGMNSEHVDQLHYKRLEVKCLVYGQLDISMWKDDCKRGRIHDTQSPDLTLSIIHYPRLTGKVVQEVITVLPVAKLVTFSLGVDLNEDVLVKTFGNLTQIENIAAVGECTNNLLKALVYLPADSSASRSTSFPCLHSLQINGVTFSSSYANRGGFPIGCLEDYLSRRRERKSPIGILTLEDCFFLYEDDVERLRKIVPRLDWDMCEQEHDLKEENGELDHYYNNGYHF